ncbi:MAG: DUF4298 domain-containing protein, partial [Lachnospiraceae bacterium]|nr:DUF4298 domain-containing protein [Lachnospiraceae bacterium]
WKWLNISVSEWSNISASNRIDRVNHMTLIYEQICAILQSEEDAAEKLQEKKAEIEELTAYYEGPLWLEDFDAEREGLFPQDMNRGILTEDAIYDLLCDIDSIYM